MVKWHPVTELLPTQTPGWGFCRGHLGQPATRSILPAMGHQLPSQESSVTIHVQFPELAIFRLSHHPHLANSLTPIQQSRFHSKFTSPMKPFLTSQGKMRCRSMLSQPSSEQFLYCKVDFYRTHPFPSGNCHSLFPCPQDPI